MPLNYIYPYTEAARAEESIASMSYGELVENLGRLADLGVLAEQNPVTMLVAARLVDRSRIERSGIGAAALGRASREYRAHPKAVGGIVKALEIAAEYLVSKLGQA